VPLSWIREKVTNDLPLVLLLALFLILGVIYNLITPLWEAPDETGHFSYVLYLTQEQRLPVMGEIHEAYQPPLYYALGAMATFWIHTSDIGELLRHNPRFIWSGEGNEINVMIHGNDELFPYHGAALAMHVVRFLSTLLGMLTVLTTYLLAREIFPESRYVALGATAINAFIPQFIFMNSVINNDSLLITLSSLCLLQMVRIIRGKEVSRATFLWLGLFLGLSLMTKQSALVLVPLAILAIVMGALKAREFAKFAKWGVVTFLLALALVLWWYLRNQFLYGDPLGLAVFHATYVQEDGITVFDNWSTMKSFLGKMHASFWARFGWMNVEADDLIIQALKLPYLAAATGLALLPLRRSHTSEDQTRLQLIAFLLLGIVACFIWVMGYCMIVGGVAIQGRNLFPAISAISTLLALGLANLLPKRLSFVPLTIFIALLALLASLSPFLYIAPAYPKQILPPSAVEGIEHPLDYTFSDSIELLGYDIEANQKEAIITLGLYWRATGTPSEDYTVFTHLLGPEGALYGQHDGYPQDGTLPTTLWRKGDIVRDIHILTIEPSAPSGNYRIRVGLYLLSTMQRLPVMKQGTVLGDYVEIENIALHSP